MKKTKISSSLMDSLEWCERKYRIKEKDGIPSGRPPHPALILGGVSHREIHNFWNKYNLDLDEYGYNIQNYYTKTIKRVSGLSRENYIKFQLYFSNFINSQIRRIDSYINKYKDDYKIITDLFFPILSEERGRIAITDDISFGFIIDSLFWNPDGNILIDWKTDKTCTEKQFESHIPQLNRYSSCLPHINHSCKKIGIYFLKDSEFFSRHKTSEYSLEKEVLDFIRRVQISKFPKVPKKDKWKCHNKDFSFTCDYYPEICIGTK